MRILWVGAHPDDELFVAAWFAMLVRDERAELHFLVATSGERGSGLLENAAPADVARIREAEMRAAAKLFGADVTFLRLPDGDGIEPRDVLRAWAGAAGGTRALHRRFRDAIAAFAPDRIVTFNRHHGCTWHADHRAVGVLMQRLALPVPVTLAESRTDFSEPLRFTPGSRRAERVDVRGGWDGLVRLLECHASQFGEALLARVRAVPEGERIAWLRDVGPWRRRDLVAGHARRAWFRTKSWIRARLG